jgi:hypothetical protein
MQVVTETPYRFDVKNMKNDVERIVALCPFFDETNQISLRHRPEASSLDTVGRLLDGVGHMKQYNSDSQRVGEVNFSVLHEAVRDSYLGEIFNKIESLYPSARGRFRVRRLRPGSCLPWHRDTLVKYHVPVQTMEGCFFITNYGAHVMPEEGRLYVVRTDIHHTALNGSMKDRIHLTVDSVHVGFGQFRHAIV